MARRSWRRSRGADGSRAKRRRRGPPACSVRLLRAQDAPGRRYPGGEHRRSSRIAVALRHHLTAGDIEVPRTGIRVPRASSGFGLLSPFGASNRCNKYDGSALFCNNGERWNAKLHHGGAGQLGDPHRYPRCYRGRIGAAARRLRDTLRQLMGERLIAIQTHPGGHLTVRVERRSPGAPGFRRDRRRPHVDA